MAEFLDPPLARHLLSAAIEMGSFSRGVIGLATSVALATAACDGSYLLRASNEEGGRATSDGGSVIVDAGDADVDAGALRVLFVGNSYTYVNDLPGMLARIAATAGTGPSITTDAVVEGGATLETHWEEGNAQKKIAEKTWTHVVLQGQSVEPLPLPGPASTFPMYAKDFGDLIVASGARPVYFATWARAAGDPIYSPIPYGDFASPAQMQDELTAAYALAAAQEPNSVLACVGEAFKRAIANAPSIVLQQTDLSHPSVAGTYLAASTFYVALTGRPVPAKSEVPDGVSAEDAATLRDIALVGTECSDVKVKGAISASWPFAADGGVAPFDFGTAGFPITTQFTLKNTGEMAVGIQDGLTLAPPFSWAVGNAFPGGSDSRFCSDVLAPGDSCTIAIAFSGAASSAGRLTIDVTGDAYTPSTSCDLRGASTSRAFLTVSETPGLFSCTDADCSAAQIGTAPSTTATLNFFVVNRGAVAATGIAEGTPLAAPYAWANGSFPGGSGTVMLGAPVESYPYCSDTLDAGATCVVTVAFSPSAFGSYDSVADLTYADATSSAKLDAKRTIAGTCRASLPP